MYYIITIHDVVVSCIYLYTHVFMWRVAFSIYVLYTIQLHCVKVMTHFNISGCNVFVCARIFCCARHLYIYMLCICMNNICIYCLRILMSACGKTTWNQIHFMCADTKCVCILIFIVMCIIQYVKNLLWLILWLNLEKKKSIDNRVPYMYTYAARKLMEHLRKWKRNGYAYAVLQLEKR